MSAARNIAEDVDMQPETQLKTLETPPFQAKKMEKDRPTGPYSEAQVNPR